MPNNISILLQHIRPSYAIAKLEQHHRRSSAVAMLELHRRWFNSASVLYQRCMNVRTAWAKIETTRLNQGTHIAIRVHWDSVCTINLIVYNIIGTYPSPSCRMPRGIWVVWTPSRSGGGGRSLPGTSRGTWCCWCNGWERTAPYSQSATHTT